MKYISSFADLRREVGDLLGAEANEQIISSVSSAIGKKDHPQYGEDWQEFLSNIDLWELFYAINS